MKNKEYKELVNILDKYRSTSLDIASLASNKLNNQLFDEVLQLYDKLEFSKEELINLQEML